MGIRDNIYKMVVGYNFLGNHSWLRGTSSYNEVKEVVPIVVVLEDRDHIVPTASNAGTTLLENVEIKVTLYP